MARTTKKKNENDVLLGGNNDHGALGRVPVVHKQLQTAVGKMGTGEMTSNLVSGCGSPVGHFTRRINSRINPRTNPRNNPPRQRARAWISDGSDFALCIRIASAPASA